MKALALRNFSHDGAKHKAGSVIEIAEAHFVDWQAVGLVKKAPEKDIKIKPE